MGGYELAVEGESRRMWVSRPRGKRGTRCTLLASILFALLRQFFLCVITSHKVSINAGLLSQVDVKALAVHTGAVGERGGVGKFL